MGLRTFIKKKIYNLKFSKGKHSEIKNKTILITGASSGIGLGLCKKLVKYNKIIAIYNKNLPNLGDIENSNFISVKCDLTDMDNYQNIEKTIVDNNVELIINCAGQFGSSSQLISNIDFNNLINILKLNSLSILKILQLIYQNNKMNYLKKIINLTSRAGSIELNDKGNLYVYRTSKSTLNSISKNLSVDLKKQFGISTITIDPGNVKTGMNQKGFLSSEKCAEYLIDIICDNKDHNGTFINLLKIKMPW